MTIINLSFCILSIKLFIYNTYLPFTYHRIFYRKQYFESSLLEEAGRNYYEFRAELMIRNNEGLTKTYNRFHDPNENQVDILRLRELHSAMDSAVLEAYGWSDIAEQARCEFLLDYEDEEDDSEGSRRRKKPWRYRWPDEIRDEVLARLLALNAERAQEEKLAAEVAARQTAKAKPQRNRSKSLKTDSPSQPGFNFDES